MSHLHSTFGSPSKRADDCLFSAILFSDLYSPEDWLAVANQQASVTVAILTAGRAYGFTDPYILPENPVGSLPDNSTDSSPSSYFVEAVAGAGGAVSNGVPSKVMFELTVDPSWRYVDRYVSDTLSHSVLCIR